MSRSDSYVDIAVIGMSLRFPGADSPEEFWQNLCNGVESITFFTDEQLAAAGTPAETLKNPDFVKANPVLRNIEEFDAAFFGFKPREAEATDPQMRLFLECAWEALESGGYDPDRIKGPVAVYGGNSLSNYFILHVLPVLHQIGTPGSVFGTVSYNEKDALTTLVSYKLNLRGPSMAVQTFCSTSLVAIHLACQSLIRGEADMALAGGVSLGTQPVAGYFFEEGGIKSPDGHNRAFDAKGKGTVFGNGSAVVLLKRLEDALRDGDTIHAVVKGSAVNNDGSQKAGYTAPSVEGQVEAISAALKVSGIDPGTIGYVETHGTGTSIGDPIEVQAMTRAFRAFTARNGYCPIGSVKTNFGHLDRAAGVAGFLKTVLAVKHGRVPPSLHFETPNPKIDFDASPFFVNTALREFADTGAPRRAGVSSLGIGGTNAHVIVEEPPAPIATSPSRPAQLLLVSARGEKTLGRAAANLARFLRQNRDVPLADVAYTLSVGRRPFQHRLAVVASTADEAVARLERPDGKTTATGAPRAADTPVAFLFPGQGAQYAQMTRGLYGSEPTFRARIDELCDALQSETGWDLRPLLYPEAADETAATERLRQTEVTQPALFVVELALAELWERWGVVPRAMLGHSLGEYVAATLAGVFTWRDALRLVAARGRLMQRCEPGVMLAVPMTEADVTRHLEDQVTVAVLNTPQSTVVGGPEAAIARVEQRLSALSLSARRVATSHAFHTAMMQPIVAEFEALVASVARHVPMRRWVSNVTGTWITAAQATDPSYWAQHLRQPVRFADGVATLLADGDAVLLEVGPGKTLGSFVRHHPQAKGVTPRASLRGAAESGDDVAQVALAAGQLWTAGVTIDWDGYWAGERRRRIPLPTYPFDRQRYWLEAVGFAPDAIQAPSSAPKRAELNDWFYTPTWKRGSAPAPYQPEPGRKTRWLVLVDDSSLSRALVRTLQSVGDEVVSVGLDTRFGFLNDAHAIVDPANPEHWDALVGRLQQDGRLPSRIVSTWSFSPQTDGFDRAQDLGFFALLGLTQALGSRSLPAPVHMGVVTSQLQNVTGDDTKAPERATILGPCRVIPQEYADLTCVNIDLIAPEAGSAEERDAVALVLGEMATITREPVVAYRGGHRWTCTYERASMPEPAREAIRLRDGGVYLITGGTGGIGLTIADYLARACRAKLVLVQRTGLPAEETWGEYIAIHGEDDRIVRRIRQVQALRAHGAEVLVLAADASDAPAMRKVIDETIARFGVLHGVFHGAGVPGDGVIQTKTREVASRVLVPKVKGALVLESLLKDLPLDFVMLFSSIAAVTGNFGQVDYCGANSALDVFASAPPASRAWPVVSVDWDAWSEVGMAVETVRRPKQAAAAAAAGFSPIEHPYFNRVREDGDTKVYAGPFSAERQWFLGEHRLLGKPTFPSTAYLEIARSVFAPIAGGRPFEFRNMFFLAPFAVPAGEEKTLELALTAEPGGEYEFVFRSAADVPGAPMVEHCRGHLVAVADAKAEPLDLAALSARCRLDERRNPDFTWDEVKDKLVEVSWHLALGARWANMRHLQFGDGVELAEQTLPTGIGESDVAATPLHPALLDFTGLLPLKINGTYIPFSFDVIRVHAPLTPSIRTWVVNGDDLQAGRETIHFDATLTDPSGRVLVEIHTMTLKRIDQTHAPADEPANVKVVMDAPGLFSNLVLRPADRPDPAAGQIEIEVAAGGLNFKDVLRALGMIPDLPGGHVSAGFGGEAAGRVTRVGPGVTTVQPGDEVMAIAPNAFGRYSVTLAPLAVPIPRGLSWEQAATIPMVYLTAYHALVNQARLQKGERILIHAAAGGVGLAAIHIAKHLGAEIYATAGSPAKREYLASLDVTRVANSRALTFADDVREWTGGQGVDVVLNSLSGEFIPASLSLLRSGGRFVEIGARDIYANTPLGLRPFANNLTFSAIDLGPLLLERPEFVREMFLAIARHFEAGEYAPSPVTAVPIAEVERAFEMMAGARHIGKIAVAVKAMPRTTRASAPAAGEAAATVDGGDAISPREGVEALKRILASRHAQVVVSPKPLVAVIDWMRNSMQAAQSSAPTVGTRVQLPRPDLSTPFVAPRTDAERKLADIWQDLLGIAEVGVHDSFFDLGGDSLIGVQVLSRVKKAFDVQLPSSVLYEGPTVESLAKLVAPQEATDEFAAQRGRAERRRQRQQERQGQE